MRLRFGATDMRASAALIASLGVLVVSIALASLAVRGLHAHVNSDEERAIPRLTVSGSGSIRVPANGAQFVLQLHSRDRLATVALGRLTRKVSNLTSALESAGVARDDIAVGDVTTARPVKDRASFTSETAIAVRVTSLGAIPDVVRALDARADLVDEIDGPRFTYGSSARLGEQAMARAVADARHKADDGARRTGMRVVGVVTLEETDGSVDRPAPTRPATSDFSGGGGGNVTVSASVAAPTPVASHPGMARAWSDVDVVFELGRR